MTDTFYAVKHWLVTLLTGPLFIELYSYIFNGESSGVLTLLPFLFIWGIILSLPALLVYYLILELTIKKVNSGVTQKIVLNVIAILFVVITLQILWGRPIPELVSGYSTAIIVCSFFIKIRKELPVENQ